MGCTLELHDEHGMAPRYNDVNLQAVFKDAAGMLFPEDHLNFTPRWGTGCSDLGDISTVMPACHPTCSGASCGGHSSEYLITDPYTACVQCAKVQAAALIELLKDDAAAAKKVLKEKKTVYNSFKEYFDAVDKTTLNIEAVTANDDGTLTLQYKL